MPRPRSLTTRTGASRCTQPRTEGPIRIPATTSSTAPGTGSRGTSASSTGTATATRAMISSPSNDRAGIGQLLRAVDLVVAERGELLGGHHGGDQIDSMTTPIPSTASDATAPARYPEPALSCS